MNYIFQEYCHKIYKIRNRYLKKTIWNQYDKSPFLHFTDLGGPLSLYNFTIFRILQLWQFILQNQNASKQ